MGKYVAHARDAVTTGERAIVLLTRSNEEWPPGIKELASASPDVRLIRCRWQTLGESVRDYGDVLAQDFVHMLEREGLVTPDPLASEDWGTWSRAGDIVGRLWTLLDEVRPEIETFADGFKSASWGVGTHWLHRYFRFQSIEVGVGFAPSRRGHVMGRHFAPARPAPESDDDPVIYAWAHDPTLAADEHAHAASDAVSSAAALAPDEALGVSWSSTPERVAIASAMVVASDFRGQLAEVVAFARETALLFARAGYGSPPRTPQLAASDPVFDRELRQRIDDVYRTNPRLPDHRSEFPWLTSYLGDPHAPVWFVAEYPSLTQVERAPFSTPEAQWNISIGDRLFREMLAKHGFKTGGEAAPGGWRCYITDIVKSTYRAKKWNAAAREELFAIAEGWSPVLAWEFETARPAILVVLGSRTKTLLDHLVERRLVPLPRTVMTAWSYVYVASRPDAARKLGPMHPVRLAEYDQQFAAIAQRRDEIATTG